MVGDSEDVENPASGKVAMQTESRSMYLKFFYDFARKEYIYIYTHTGSRRIAWSLYVCKVLHASIPKNPWTLHWRGLNLYSRGV